MQMKLIRGKAHCAAFTLWCIALYACGASSDPSGGDAAASAPDAASDRPPSGSGGAAGSGAESDSSAASGMGGNGGGIGTGGGPGTEGADATAADGGGAACTSPVFVTSDRNGGWSNGGYFVHNNMWNAAAGLGPETLYACSYHDWYVVSNQTNNAGAVKTYPNVHKDYDDVPISSFNIITSSFAETSSHVGIYNVAYDIWTNGVATAGSTELMIWTENYNQVPAGTRVTTTTLGGRTYDVWKTSDNHYIAFVPTVVFTSGSLDLLQLFQWTMSQGWLRLDSTLGQIDFGVEIVSTNGADARFEFTDFSISDN